MKTKLGDAVLFAHHKRLLHRVPEGVDSAALIGVVGLLNDGQTLVSDIAAGIAGLLSDLGIKGHLFQTVVVEAERLGRVDHFSR